MRITSWMPPLLLLVACDRPPDEVVCGDTTNRRHLGAWDVESATFAGWNAPPVSCPRPEIDIGGIVICELTRDGVPEPVTCALRPELPPRCRINVPEAP
jgi:hypothetical protein